MPTGIGSYGTKMGRPAKKKVQKAKPINGRKLTKAEQLEDIKRRNKAAAPGMKKLMASRAKSRKPKKKLKK